MKRPLLALTTGLSAVLIAGLAQANSSETGRVTTIIVEGTDLISINLSGMDATSECSGGGRWTINRTTDPLFKEKYAAILAAAASGQEITLVHLSSSGCGDWTSNKIYYVQTNY